ncbi:MAG TPA: M56 family metallopeptidase [Puia sp.]|nr:M56 family metallopeptidase [Puia sp.]
MATHDITRALCLMLAHSLWQGFLAAVIAGMVILCTRKSTASLRYNLLMLDLLLFLTLAAATFWHELGGSGTRLVSGGKVIVEETRMLAGIQMDASVGAGRTATLMGRAGHFLNRHSATIVAVWMFCLLGQLVHLTGGLYQMGRLRRYRVFAAGEEWKDRLSALMMRLGIRKPVELLQSGLISVPVTFGYLKPTILVPLGMLANLPADQVETILLHELAHISRNDYLTNLLLHVTEAIFFFNPGIRWIASLLRDEREACCDDVVLQGTENRNSYFDALVAFKELAIGRQGYGLQLGAGKKDLLWRIRRMLNQENKKLRFMEKAILSCGLTAILAICLITLRAGDRGPVRHKAIIAAAVSENDTIPVKSNASEKKAKVQFPSITTSIADDGTTKKYKINATDADGNTFLLTKVNGQVTELVINGKPVPEKDFDQYLYIFEEIENRSHPTADEREGEDQMDAAKRELDEAQEGLERVNQQQAEAAQQREAEKEEALAKVQDLEALANVQNQETLDKAQKEALDRAPNQEALAKAQKEALEKAQEQVDRFKDQQDSMQQRLREAQEKMEAANQEIQERAAERQQKVMEEYEEKARRYQEKAQEHNKINESIEAIKDDIIGHGLAANGDEIQSFRLDRNGLTVNGSRSAAAIFKDFKEKYLTGDNDHFIFMRNANGGIHTEVSTGN